MPELSVAGITFRLEKCTPSIARGLDRRQVLESCAVSHLECGFVSPLRGSCPGRCDAEQCASSGGFDEQFSAFDIVAVAESAGASRECFH